MILRAVSRVVKLRLLLNIMHEMKARQEFIDRSLNDAFKSFYTGFLTDKEMTEVIDGRDMWMGKDEIIERWSYKIGRTTREG